MPRAIKEINTQTDWANFDWSELDWGEVRWADIPWDKINWADPDFGRYANLCPDARRADFEYGAYCIERSAEIGTPLDDAKPPTKIKYELDHLEDVISKLSFDAMMHLNSPSSLHPRPLDGPVDRFLRLIRRASDDLSKRNRGPDKVRQQLGVDTSAIWSAHGGNVDDKEFVVFVDRLIDGAGLGRINERKARINCDTLVREVRRDVAARREAAARRGVVESGAPPWRLWGD